MKFPAFLPVCLAAAWALTACGGSADPAGKAGGTAVGDPAVNTWEAFSGERAFAHVKAMVDIGPRPAGSEAVEQTRAYLTTTLEAAGWAVQRQEFTDTTPRGEVKFANLRARFPAGDAGVWDRKVRTLVGSHFDTKWFEGVSFVGANDAGSSTGLLLEAARVIATDPEFAKSLELVFFDGEEAFVRFTATDGLYGSRHYARELRKTDPEKWPAFLVLFDMVGDKDLRIEIPTNGSQRLRQAAFTAAEELGLGRHIGLYPGEILDDHVPLANIGLEVVNLIDFSYQPWHTSGDTLDKISAESLEISGRIGLLLLEKHLP